MNRSRTAPELAALVSVGACLLAVVVPAFLRNLRFSKQSEAVDGLNTLVTNALSYAEGRPQDICFPPSAPLTPAEVPRGAPALDPPEAWEHLTWKSLRFGFDAPHHFSFKFDSRLEPNSRVMHFTATAHGDLDGD
ncbi:MAG: hypothetical protein AAGA56_19760, partial [Myxococcota bacterium]